MKKPIGWAGKFGWDRAQSKAVNVPTPAARKARSAIRNDLRPANFMSMRCERSFPMPERLFTALVTGDRVNERVPIKSGLTRAKILGSPFEDICEIEFCRSAEAKAPFPFDHEAPICPLG